MNVGSPPHKGDDSRSRPTAIFTLWKSSRSPKRLGLLQRWRDQETYRPAEQEIAQDFHSWPKADQPIKRFVNNFYERTFIPHDGFKNRIIRIIFPTKASGFSMTWRKLVSE